MLSSAGRIVRRPRVGTITENVTWFTTALSERAAAAALRPSVLAGVGLRRALLPRRRASLHEDAPAPPGTLGRAGRQARRRPRLESGALPCALFRERARGDRDRPGGAPARRRARRRGGRALHQRVRREPAHGAARSRASPARLRRSRGASTAWPTGSRRSRIT